MAERSKRSILKFPSLFVSGRGSTHHVGKQHHHHHHHHLPAQAESTQARLRSMSFPKVSSQTRQVHMRHGKDLQDCLSVQNLIGIAPGRGILDISKLNRDRFGYGFSKELSTTTDSSLSSSWGSEGTYGSLSHNIVVNGCSLQVIGSLDIDSETSMASTRKGHETRVRLDPLPFCHKLFPRPKRPDSAKSTRDELAQKPELKLPRICDTPTKQDRTRQWAQNIPSDRTDYTLNTKKQKQQKTKTHRDAIFTEGRVEITTSLSTSIVTVYLPSPNPCYSSDSECSD